MNDFKVREIAIGDDYFNYDPKHVIAICREIVKRKFDLAFSCPNGLRIETFNKELLTIMRKTGFYATRFAVESGSQSILNRVNKKLDLSKMYNIVKTAKRLGFFLNSYFIFGLPGETYETARRTIQVAKKLPIDVISCFVAQPLPGSLWFKEWVLTQDKIKIEYNRFQFYIHKSSLVISDGNRKLRLPVDVYREIYYRPIQIARYIRYWVNTFHLDQSFAPIGRLTKQIFNLFNR